jgi:hypothetical protein
MTDPIEFAAVETHVAAYVAATLATAVQHLPLEDARNALGLARELAAAVGAGEHAHVLRIRISHAHGALSRRETVAGR